MPTWLLTPGPVLLKCHVRTSRSDPFVNEIQLLQVNPYYAHLQHIDRWETTVSIQHLAPSGSPNGSTNVLQWHVPQAETGSLSDRATVVDSANDNHQEHPAENVPTTITTTEEDTHIPVAPEGATTCQQTPQVLPHLETRLLLPDMLLFSCIWDVRDVPIIGSAIHMKAEGKWCETRYNYYHY